MPRAGSIVSSARAIRSATPECFFARSSAAIASTVARTSAGSPLMPAFTRLTTRSLRAIPGLPFLFRRIAPIATACLMNPPDFAMLPRIRANVSRKRQSGCDPRMWQHAHKAGDSSASGQSAGGDFPHLPRNGVAPRQSAQGRSSCGSCLHGSRAAPSSIRLSLRGVHCGRSCAVHMIALPGGAPVCLGSLLHIATGRQSIRRCRASPAAVG